MTPRPYSEKSALPNDSSNDVLSGVQTQVLPETPSPPSLSQATTPSPTPQEEITIEPFVDTVVMQETSRIPDFAGVTPCYPTPGDIMPYDHSLPDFIRQITNQPNLANLQALSLRVISTLISLHRMSSYLPNLKELDLEGSVLNSLRDIGCSLKNLQILKVGRCQLESLDGTFGLSSLRELYAQKNFINDVSPCSNLPHIRHIDVSGFFYRNRIRNISYAGFLSVCSKLKSIVFTGNPATEVPDYRRHVRRILPQLETLDGVPLTNEDDEGKQGNSCEGSDSSSTGIPDFLSVSPSDSLNNFFDSEEDLSVLDKKNKQAKNLANQDHFEAGDHEVQEALPDALSNVEGQDEFQNLSSRLGKGKSGILEQAKVMENRNMSFKQKCTSIQKLDKDIENRSKKSNFHANLSEDFIFSSERPKNPPEDENMSSPSTSSGVTDKEDPRKARMKGKESSTSGTDLPGSFPGEVTAEDIKLGATKKLMTSAVSNHNSDEELGASVLGVSKLCSGLPVCGNLTAALRNRKKVESVWEEKQKRLAESEEGGKAEFEEDGSGEKFDWKCGVEEEDDAFEENILAGCKKWREEFGRYRADKQLEWEEDQLDELESMNSLKESLGLGAVEVKDKSED